MPNLATNTHESLLNYPPYNPYHLQPMSNLMSLTSAQLKRAANLKDKISALEKELVSILGASQASAPKKKGTMSAAGRAKISAAQKERWAKVKGTKSVGKKKS